MGSTTTVNALPYPGGSDANNVPADIQALADRVDAGSIIERMSTATRDALAAGRKVAGVVIYNSTTQTLQKYNGSTWDDVALIASPTFTGTPAAPTAAVDTNTTQLATTAFVLAQAASATPLINGTATVGTSTRFARGDHVHPTPGAWTAWTPTVAQAGNTISSYTTQAGAYQQVGKTVHARFRIVLNSVSGTATVAIRIGISGLPTPTGLTAEDAVGTAVYKRVGTAYYQGALCFYGSGELAILAHSSPDYIGGSPAFAVASSHIITGSLTYEAA